MAHLTLRQAIQTWQQRLDLTGVGLVEATLEHGPIQDGWTDSSLAPDASIDVTMARLARQTPSQFAVELAYPWGREDGHVGALLGIFSDSCSCWVQADAA